MNIPESLKEALCPLCGLIAGSSEDTEYCIISSIRYEYGVICGGCGFRYLVMYLEGEDNEDL